MAAYRTGTSTTQVGEAFGLPKNLWPRCLRQPCNYPICLQRKCVERNAMLLVIRGYLFAVSHSFLFMTYYGHDTR
jgi:hypothetical protein